MHGGCRCLSHAGFGFAVSPFSSLLWPPNPFHLAAASLLSSPPRLWKCPFETHGQPRPNRSVRSPLAAGHVAAASCVAAGTLPSPAPTHAEPAVTAALLPDLREITALPSDSVSLLAFICLFCSGRRLLCVTGLTVPWQPGLSWERCRSADHNRSTVSRVPIISRVPALPLVRMNCSPARLSCPWFGDKWALPGRRFGLCVLSCTFVGTVKTETWLCLSQHRADCTGGLDPMLETSGWAMATSTHAPASSLGATRSNSWGWGSTEMLLGGLLGLQDPSRFLGSCWASVTLSSQQLAVGQAPGKAYPVGRESLEDRGPLQSLSHEAYSSQEWCYFSWVAPAGTLPMAYSPPQGLLGPNPCSSHVLRCHADLSRSECLLTPWRGSRMSPTCAVSRAWGEGMATRSFSPLPPALCVSLPCWKAVYWSGSVANYFPEKQAVIEEDFCIW